MYTKEDTPWIDYLVIDDETLETYINSDAPEGIKRAYEQHLKKIREDVNERGMIAK